MALKGQDGVRICQLLHDTVPLAERANRGDQPESTFWVAIKLVNLHLHGLLLYIQNWVSLHRPTSANPATIIKGYPNNSGSPCESDEEGHVHDHLALVVEGDGLEVLQLVVELRPETAAKVLRLLELESDAIPVLVHGHHVVKLHLTNS